MGCENAAKRTWPRAGPGTVVDGAGAAPIREDVRPSWLTSWLSLLHTSWLSAQHQRGQTNIEFAFVIVLVSLSAITTLTLLGPAWGEPFQEVADIFAGF